MPEVMEAHLRKPSVVECFLKSVIHVHRIEGRTDHRREDQVVVLPLWTDEETMLDLGTPVFT